MTEHAYIIKLEAIFSEINLLTEDVKQIKSEAKADGFKPTKLAKIAKLKADAKVAGFLQDSKEIVDYIEQNNL